MNLKEMRRIPLLFLLFLNFMLSACNRQHEFNGIVYAPPSAAPTLSGIRENGSAFQISDTKGKVTLLFFGYTHCPDICPLTMAQIANIYRTMGNEASEIQVIFVSTDPERDTPEQLAGYVKTFDANFWGVQVPQANLATTLKAYDGLTEKDAPAQGQSAEQYTITHSNWIYAIDRQSNLRLLFWPQLQPEEMIDDLRALLNE